MERNGYYYHYVQDTFGAFQYEITSPNLIINNDPDVALLQSQPFGKQVINIFLEKQKQGNLTRTDPNEHHNSCVGLLYMQEDNEKGDIAIASLVSRNVALTCAHVLRKNGRQSKLAYLFMGVNKKYGKAFKVKKWIIPKEYKKQPENWDLALLELEGDPGHEYGYLSIHLQSIQELPLSAYNDYRVYSYESINQKQKTLVSCLSTLHNMPQKWSIHGSPLLLKFESGTKMIALYFGGPTKSIILEEKHRVFLNELIKIQKGEMDLNYKKIGDQGLKHLVEEKWPRLKNLSLRTCDIGKDGAQALAFLNAESLTHLVLAYNFIGNNIQGLLRANIPNLQSLDLLDNRMGDEGVAYLVRGNWPKLEYLCLTRNHIGNQGRLLIAQCNWPKLYFLQMNQNHLHKLCGQHFLRFPWVKKYNLTTENPIGPPRVRNALQLKFHLGSSASW